AHRISPENVSQRLCGDCHGFVYAFHLVCTSPLSFNLALVLHFGSVQAARASSGFRSILEVRFQFPDMLRLKVTNQTSGCPSDLKILFNYQSPLASDVHPVNASSVPTQLIESAAHTAQEIVEASGNPESSENRASIVAVRVCRSDGRELMRRGRWRANGTGYMRMRANR